MFGEEIAGEHRRDRLIAIQRDVDGEVDAGHPRDLAHVVVDRIALGDAPRRVGMSDTASVVQREHGFEAREAGRYHLRPAAEAGEEMRFHEAGRDAYVGVQPLAIQVHGHAGRGCTRMREAR